MDFEDFEVHVIDIDVWSGMETRGRNKCGLAQLRIHHPE
jgi:hypothetical protein